MEKLIEIKDLSKYYDELCVLDKINFSIGRGELLSIMGSSGVGKTTFLNILLGLDKDFQGSYVCHTEKIATVFQEDRLLPWMSIYENLILINQEVEDSKIQEVLEVMKLFDFMDFKPPQLSGGMKQRVAIARALCYDGDLIIMDEPLKSTDKNLSDEILQYLKMELKRQNKSLIMVTHDVENALNISEYIYVLENQPASFSEIIEVGDNKKEIADKLNLKRMK